MLRWPLLAASIALVITACSPTPPEPSGPTEAEYRAAAQAAADCIVDRGFDAYVAKSPTAPDYEIGIQNVPEEKDAEAENAYNECTAEHLNQVALAYHSSRRLTGAERDAAMAELVRCLEAQGMTGIDAGQTDSTVFYRAVSDQLEEGTDAYHEAIMCMDRARNAWPPGDPNNP